MRSIAGSDVVALQHACPASLRPAHHGNNLAPDEGIPIFFCTMTDHVRNLGKM
jgi:hypothetical protein